MTAHTTVYRHFLFVSALVLGALGVPSRSSALVTLAAACATLVLLARARARRVLRTLDGRRAVEASAHEDDAVRVDLWLDNRGRRPVHLVRIVDSFGAAVADRQAVLEPGPLGADRRRHLRYRTLCSRTWGVYPVGPLTLAVADPTGLGWAERPVSGIEGFAVFPRVYEVAALDTLGGRASMARQDTTAGRAGRSATYLGVREYRPGDDPRHIHWPATARRGVPVVKEHEVDLVPYFTLFLDLDARNRAGVGAKSTREYLVRTAASLLFSASRRGHFTQLVAEGRQPLALAPGTGALHLAHALSELIRVRQDGSTPVLDLVARQHHDVPEGSTAAVLAGSTALDREALADLLHVFRARGVRPVLVLVDADSFAPVDRWPVPREKARERNRELLGYLRSWGAGAVVLESEQDLPATLGRADLFWADR